MYTCSVSSNIHVCYYLVTRSKLLLPVYTSIKALIIKDKFLFLHYEKVSRVTSILFDNFTK